MEKNRKRLLVEWSIYLIALVSLTFFIYMFSMHNTTALLLSESNKESFKEKDGFKREKIEIENLELEHFKKEPLPLKKPEPIENLSKKEEKQPILNKEKEQPKKIPRELKVSKKEMDSHSSKKSIKGLALFQKPVILGSSSYNWVVLSRFKEKPSKNLLKIGKYTVSKGEDIYSIARKFKNVPINLIAANPQLKDPDILNVGDQLFIPNK